jgi:hypothetical protein
VEIDEVAGRLEAIAARLGAASSRAARLDPGRSAFGATGSGECGDLGRALAAACTSALHARDDESGRAADAASSLATALRGSLTGYHATEAQAHHRVGGL